MGIYYLKRGFHKQHQVSSLSQPSVSIIVSMHNEEKNVKRCLEKLVDQNYPNDKFEIIIVNDRSSDNTGDLIESYAKKYPFVRYIKIVKLQDEFAPKKYAIDQAIKSARGEIILLTDADGRPTPQWIQQMTSYFAEDVGLVIGYAPYSTDSENSSFWTRLLSLEYFSHAAVAAASCGLGYSVTCVGTNMAYRKDVYEQLGGYGDFKRLHTGDDDLFLQRVRDESDWRITYATGKSSHVYNAPPGNWNQFFQQRIRYASKGFNYPLKVTLILVLFYFLNLLLLISLISLLTCTSCVLPFFAALILKAVSDFSFLKSASLLLGDKRFLKLFPVALVLHIPYVVFFGFFAQLVSFKWADHSS
jgi:cellulose synthase/poly-beta-1,6-N-acetylglucosamine synthase-like glycosyltransferase